MAIQVAASDTRCASGRAWHGYRTGSIRAAHASYHAAVLHPRAGYLRACNCLRRIAGPVAGLRLELAAISARNDEDARTLLFLSVLAMLPVSLVSVFILWILKARGIGAYGALSWCVVGLTGATIAGAGLYASLRSWLVRRGRIRLISNSLAVQGCLRAGIPWPSPGSPQLRPCWWGRSCLPA